eukprot:CAMPEP_0174284564 /NCGR_PEP_ID=MMETSP0809-20121228/5954_1 /TAXON_ID=73025 ORGANISM="Eutreptiella gymnastica-like, Strain CCMP1594" /NCGR_SAMPLE_ID=MMETSP0809 /ASSEMBLY_ACC=CAM_ASM_000658 /LENGTH=159 /DNA_ID=CAMNT_0015380105 /DNA_START=22 /DNA_END=501 /DNA_ORIENTATION=+
MPHSWGLKARTRDLFSKGFRCHGRPSLTTYLAIFKIGDYVDICNNSAVHKGAPYKFYQGKTGRVWNVTPRALGVLVNKRVRGRIMQKKVTVRTEHVRKSRCQEEFKARVRHNERVRCTGVGQRIKRLPAQPKPAMTVQKKNEPLPLGAKKFVFSEVYDF